MEDADELLENMYSLIQKASTLSTDLVDFIRAESIPLGEVLSDWLICRASDSVRIAHREAQQLVEQRRITTRIKAKRMFAGLELAILSDWQTLETKALTLSINVILKKERKRVKNWRVVGRFVRYE